MTVLYPVNVEITGSHAYFMHITIVKLTHAIVYSLGRRIDIEVVGLIAI